MAKEVRKGLGKWGGGGIGEIEGIGRGRRGRGGLTLFLELRFIYVTKIEKV
jgi:hypothetical protein